MSQQQESEMPGGLQDSTGNTGNTATESSNNSNNEQAGNDIGPVQRVASNRKPLDMAQWKSSVRKDEENIVPGLDNDDVWLLIRRFNKQIYSVKAAPEAPLRELDLRRAEDEQFPPEKLRLTVERFYTSVIVGVVSTFKHIGRLRSWSEPRRTAFFCAAYFIAWAFDSLALLFMGVLVSLVLFRRTRSLLFPPPSATKTGSGRGDASNNKPVIEETDSLTGAPEEHRGETAEREASELWNNFANIAAEGASGVYGQDAGEDAPEEQQSVSESVETATAVSTTSSSTAVATASATTESTTTEAAAPAPAPGGEDKPKKPGKKKASDATNKTMRVISDITDLYERFANVLSPTTPFLAITPRLRLVGILVTLCLASHYTPNYVIVKSGGFAFGMALFGDPVLKGSLDFMNRTVPNWWKYLDPQKTLLKGSPTNAQLTLTLLRIGEMTSSPLPPPPNTKEPEPEWPLNRRKSKPLLTAGDSTNNPDTATREPPDLPDRTNSSTSNNSSSTNNNKPGKDPTKSKRRFISKLFKFVRRTVSTAVKSRVAMDRAMALVGSTHTRSLIDTIRRRGWISAPYGPLTFEGKFERKRGTVVIDSSMEPPVLYFTTYQSAGLDDLRLETKKERSVLFHIPVTEIRELRKTEGLGWKRKTIVELTAGSKDASGGLVVLGVRPGQHYQLTSMSARNQLFNRLIAIDAQFWESR